MNTTKIIDQKEQKKFKRKRAGLELFRKRPCLDKPGHSAIRPFWDKTRIRPFWDKTGIRIFQDQIEIRPLWDRTKIGSFWDGTRIWPFRDQIGIGPFRDRSGIGPYRDWPFKIYHFWDRCLYRPFQNTAILVDLTISNSDQIILFLTKEGRFSRLIMTQWTREYKLKAELSSLYFNLVNGGNGA